MTTEVGEISNQVTELLEKQRNYFATGATRGWGARKDALNRLERVLVAKREEILDALGKDLGKPDVEAYLAEYYFLLQELRMIRKSLKKWLKSRRVSSPFYFQPCQSVLRRDPYGVGLIVAPWNYPVQLSLSPLIAAVAAGNTVILKPSEIASATEQLLVDIITKAFEPEHVAVVTGDAEVSADLLGRQYDFIFFTGSTNVGRIVARKAAEHMTPNVLELGGKCPCVVDESANLQVAAQRILAGKFFNGGQTCFAPDFVAVAAERKDKLVAAMREQFQSVPWNKEMAHVVNERHYKRLKDLIPEGAEMFGEDMADSLRLAPRLVVNAQWGDAIMEEEIFGPILPVVTYTNYDELIESLRSYGSPLALYIFSEDRNMQSRLMRDIRSGGVCINDTMKQGSNLSLPFGGVGESGYGRYRGRAGLDAFSYERAVVRRPGWAPDWFEMAPPYGDKIKWLKQFLR